MMGELSPEAGRIEGLIYEAFAGVSLGDGMGMREADAGDSYEESPRVAAARDMDERESWERLALGDVLRFCEFAWVHFDARGLVFHLPAMMRVVLREEIDELYLADRLGLPGKQRERLWDALSVAQRLAVREFMRWAAESMWSEFVRANYSRGLEEFWTVERIGAG